MDVKISKNVNQKRLFEAKLKKKKKTMKIHYYICFVIIILVVELVILFWGRKESA